MLRSDAKSNPRKPRCPATARPAQGQAAGAHPRPHAKRPRCPSARRCGVVQLLVLELAGVFAVAAAELQGRLAIVGRLRRVGGVRYTHVVEGLVADRPPLLLLRLLARPPGLLSSASLACASRLTCWQMQSQEVVRSSTCFGKGPCSLACWSASPFRKRFAYCKAC